MYTLKSCGIKDVQIPFIKAANVSYIQASLYSMNPEIHDKITTLKGSHKKTREAIENLLLLTFQFKYPVH